MISSRERLKETLAHRQPDRIPLDIGGTAVTGIHVLAVEKLRRYYALDKIPVRVIDPYQMLGEMEEDLLTAMGIDVTGLYPKNTLFGFPLEDWKEWRAPWGQELLVPGAFQTAPDGQGGLLIYPEGDRSVPPSGHMPAASYFFDSIIRQPPIDDQNLNVTDNLEEFKFISETDLDYFRQQAALLAETDYGVIANFGGTAFGDIALVPAPFLKHPKGIRDISEWYMSTISRQDYIHRIFDYQADVVVKNLAKIFPVTGETVDAVFICGTDFGTQSSSFCSTDTFDRLYKPYYRRVNDWIHEHTHWKTFKHSCGAVEPFMDHFIDAGFDIINPVQCTAKGMDPRYLKKTYGDKLTFWGGGADTQGALSLGTPEQVYKQVSERCEIFSENGGFVFNTVHNIQATTPLENLAAMMDAIHQFNAHSE